MVTHKRAPMRQEGAWLLTLRLPFLARLRLLWRGTLAVTLTVDRGQPQVRGVKA